MFCGVVHREAGTSPWADDRRLADEPAWYQLAAPYWHTALPDSASIASVLTAAVDPMTSASRPGDVRAVAALAAAAAAAVMLLGLSRAAVPFWLAALMTAATVASSLPVAAAVTITHSLMALGAASFLLLSAAPGSVSLTQRLASSALTIVGAAVHPAFVPFAAGVWIADTWKASDTLRWRVLVTGLLSVCAAVLVAVVTLNLHVATAPSTPVPSFSTLLLALPGFFPGNLAPAATVSLGDTIALISPIPWLVWTPAVALAIVVARDGWLEARCALGGLFAVAFASTTWVPDPAVAVAPATIAMLVLVARALTWIWRQSYTGARGFAVAAAIAIAAAGFVTPRPMLRTDNAGMQAFVDAASRVAEGAPWSADRLATTRALLYNRPALAQGRTPFDDSLLRDTEADQSRTVFVNEATMTRAPRGLWFASRPLPYENARTFLMTLPDTTWLAFAFRGDVSGGFCHDLLDAAGTGGAEGATQGVALVHPGYQGATVSAADFMEIPFDTPVGTPGLGAPARFELDARSQPRILINGATTAEAVYGLAVGLFDPPREHRRGYVFANCDGSVLPEIEDRRLRAAYVVERTGDEALPAVPAVGSVPVEVRFDERGAPWFGPGWHGVEAEPMRWTSAREAQVNVVSARSQPLRIRLQAEVPGAPPESRGVSVTWNGEFLRAPEHPSSEGDWVVPAALVRRGLNRMTLIVDRLVSPADGGASSDTRLLGAAVRHLSFTPVQSATTPAPSTARP